MFKDNRSILAVIAGLFALGVAFGLGSYVTATIGSEEPQYQSHPHVSDRPFEAKTDHNQPNVSSLEYRAPCEKPTSLQESDLCAQWRSADAAQVSAIWAERSFWVAAFGVIGLIITITQSRIALDRARESNRISQMVAENSIRPYLYPEYAEVDRVDGRRVYIVVMLKNFGGGMARRPNFFIKNYSTLFEFKGISGFYSGHMPMPDTAPGGYRRLYRYFFLKEGENDDLREYRSTIVIRISYIYHDDYGNLFKERYSYSLIGEPKVGEKLALVDTKIVLQRRRLISLGKKGGLSPSVEVDVE